MSFVAVHEFVFADGKPFGLGSALELKYWQSEGVIDPDARLGKIIGQEDASEDERRKTCWGIGDFLDNVTFDPTGERIAPELLA